MARANQEQNRIADPYFERGLRFSAKIFTPADNAVINVTDPPLLIVSPAGAIDMLLPAASEATRGLMFIICNNSANAVTLKTSGDAAFTTAIVLAANETTIVVCTGDTTAALGWRAVATASSA